MLNFWCELFTFLVRCVNSGVYLDEWTNVNKPISQFEEN